MVKRVYLAVNRLQPTGAVDMAYGREQGPLLFFDPPEALLLRSRDQLAV